MKIGIVCGFKIGSKKAHAINTVNLANGFLKLKAIESVTIYAKVDDEQLESELASWTEEFYFLEMLTVKGYSSYEDLEGLLEVSKHDFIYLRDYRSLAICNKLKIRSVVESHAHIGNSSVDFLKMIEGLRAESCAGLTTINETLRDYYVSIGAPDAKTIVLPDCVDYDHFAPLRHVTPSTTAVKVYYIGHLYRYKGILTLLKAAKISGEIKFVIVGGNSKQILFWKLVNFIVTFGAVNNVEFTGWISHAKLPQSILEANMFVLPPESWHPSAEWTSPVKMAEYLATGRPTICSDIPALKRWVTDDEVFWFEAGDAKSLSNVISSISRQKKNLKNAAQLIAARNLDYKVKALSLLRFSGLTA